jgi:hypothetical protein
MSEYGTFQITHSPYLNFNGTRSFFSRAGILQTVNQQMI